MGEREETVRQLRSKLEKGVDQGTVTLLDKLLENPQAQAVIDKHFSRYYTRSILTGFSFAFCFTAIILFLSAINTVYNITWQGNVIGGSIMLTIGLALFYKMLKR